MICGNVKEQDNSNKHVTSTRKKDMRVVVGGGGKDHSNIPLKRERKHSRR